MSTTLTPQQSRPAVTSRPRRHPGRWRRRWHRFTVPFAVFAMLFMVTVVAHVAEEPNLRDAETLAPTGTGADGSSRLAELLTERGVRIEEVSDYDSAVTAVQTGGEAVVFVPKPNVLGSAFAARALANGHRVVMVAPENRHLWFSPVRVATSRWASKPVEPGCEIPEAVAAGRAAALRKRYQVAAGHSVSCYDQGLLLTWVDSGELVVIGASDPFRNRRIDEHGNATLAVELLSRYGRVIWAGALSATLDVGAPMFDPPQVDSPEFERPKRPERDRSQAGMLSDLFYGYPSTVVAGLVLAALVGVLLALARARRLGPPVSEPLPVVVPAAEAVAGRGRLYQRSRGRGAALAALRTAALRRLVPALGLPAAPPPAPEAVVAAVVARTGLPEDYVRSTLYGPEPERDAELAAAVAALDNVVAAVTGTSGGHRNGGVQA